MVLYRRGGELPHIGACRPTSATTTCIAYSSSPNAAELPGDAVPAAGASSNRCSAAERPASANRRTALILQVDGTPGSGRRGTAGIGIVVRGPGGRVWFWRCVCAPAATSNEAEYQAVIAGLTLVAERHPAAALCCLNDNRIVIDQLAGRCAVRAPQLLPLHARALALASRFAAVEFRCIPRELNRLADALAWEALAGHYEVLRALGSA